MRMGCEGIVNVALIISSYQHARFSGMTTKTMLTMFASAALLLGASIVFSGGKVLPSGDLQNAADISRPTEFHV